MNMTIDNHLFRLLNTKEYYVEFSINHFPSKKIQNHHSILLLNTTSEVRIVIILIEIMKIFSHQTQERIVRKVRLLKLSGIMKKALKEK